MILGLIKASREFKLQRAWIPDFEKIATEINKHEPKEFNPFCTQHLQPFVHLQTRTRKKSMREDQSVYVGYYKTTYDEVGKLYRTILNSVSVGKTADGVFSVAQPDFTLAVDERRNQATVELPLKQGQELSFNTGLADGLFKPTELLKRGGM